MPRTSIRASTSNVVTDNGSTDFSIIQGEQLSTIITLGYFTNLAGAEVYARVIEADNDGAGTKPTAVKSGASSQALTVLEEDGSALTDNTFPSDYSSNKFKLVIEGDTLFDSWSPSPFPGDAGRVYGFWEIETRDIGSGSNQQIHIPVRGLLIVRYSIGG